MPGSGEGRRVYRAFTGPSKSARLTRGSPFRQLISRWAGGNRGSAAAFGEDRRPGSWASRRFVAGPGRGPGRAPEPTRGRGVGTDIALRCQRSGTAAPPARPTGADMNPETFTNRAREAISAALDAARARRHPEVTPTHLALALVEPDDGYVAAVLRHLGAKKAEVLADLEGLLKSNARVSGAEPAMARSFASVLDEASALAKARGDSHVSVEILLLAILSKGDGPLVAALGHRGLTKAALELAIEAVRAGQPVEGDNPETAFE